MKRSQMKRAINRYLARLDASVLYYRYVSSAPPQGTPYRQRKRTYSEPITLTCTIAERKTENVPSSTGDAKLRRFELGLGPDQIVKAFHPLDYDDPRKTYDPSLIISDHDIVEIRGIRCKIISVTKHGDEGAGPLWYLMFAVEDIES
jgi:hypothetical protein